MSNLKKLSSIVLFCLITTLSVAQTISIQSTLKNISGEAVSDGNENVTFKLYTADEGGSALWTETASVEVTSGIFSHELGSITPLEPGDFGSQLYLGITVKNKELSPRTKLGYAPYALAVNALAGGGESAGFDNNGNFEVTGNVGILTTDPMNHLSIGHPTTGIAGGSNYLDFRVDDSAPIGTKMRIRDDGNVGIGTLEPQFDLSFHNDWTGIDGSASQLTFNVSNTTAQSQMIIKSDGKVGINGTGTQGISDPQLFLTIGADNTGIDANTNYMDFRVGDAAPINSKIRITDQGRVGIGTITPEATLHVKGTSAPGGNSGIANGGSNNFTYFQGGSGFLNATPTTNICAYFEQSILADAKVYAGNVANWSDSRVKTNLKKSNSQKDLALLNQIEITEYDHIDKQNNDNRTQKKVIAQQVEKVIPNAISKAYKVIPNVYEVAKKIEHNDGILTIETNKTHDFVEGDFIDLISPNMELDRIEVIEIIDKYTFTIKADEKPKNIFVYGKYVDDFLAVDYDAISMLNVSATQEMYRMIIDLQKTNQDLLKENRALKTSSAKIENELNTLKSNSASIADRLTTLESLLSQIDRDKVMSSDSTKK